LERSQFFELFGLVLGLAAYNSVMIDMPFPDVFYKKLLTESWDKGKQEYTGDLEELLDELSQVYPEVHRGLMMLLSWDSERDGGTVEEIFCRNFEISYDVLGQVKTYPLVENGSDIPVTEDNRKDYCSQYARHLLYGSIRKPFASILKGFWTVVGGPSTDSPSSKQQHNHCRAIRLFRPEELRLLLTGLSADGPTDLVRLYSASAFCQLRAAATYDGYEATSVYICDFWDIVLDEFTDDQRRKLLWFVTASDRIPLGGLRQVTFVVQKNGTDDSRLPTAMTCFGRLLLPQYSDRDLLKLRLAQAIEESQGFGLM
jgi:hypothetical protein